MNFQKQFRTTEDILKTLITLDHYCTEEEISAELVMLGGSAILTVMEYYQKDFRPTMDIDINVIHTTNMNRFMEQLQKVNIEIVGGVMEVPPFEDFKDKKSIQEIDMDFDSINVYLPNLELLACCKIFSTRSKDLNDLEETGILKNCNKEKLLELVEEYKPYLLNPDNPDLNVHQLGRIFKEKGI